MQAEGEEGEEEGAAVDYGFYRSFWKLQKYFLNPNLCFKSSEWKQLTTCADDVLKACASLRLDSGGESSDSGGGGGGGGAADNSEIGTDEYFAKYVVSCSLNVSLQLHVLFFYLQPKESQKKL
jgi:hypothetical protein